jgi:hypothetical protein
MRFHRLKMAMEGTAPKPRPKTDPDGNTSKPAQPVNRKRKAKGSAGEKLRKKLAELEADEDDEEPLAELAAKRRRVKQEGKEDDASGDEYVDVEVKDEGVRVANEDEGNIGGNEDEGVRVKVKEEMNKDDLLDEGLYDLPSIKPEPGMV